MWYKLLERNHFLLSLYENPPELKNVRIAEVMIHDEGRIVAIIFDMPYFPERPPEKWEALGDNKVSVRIDFSAVHELSMTSSSVDYRGDIQLFKDDTDLLVVRIAGTVHALIKAESGFIQTITSYSDK